MTKYFYLKNIYVLSIFFILFTMCQQNKKDIKNGHISRNDTLIKINIDKLEAEKHILFSSIFSGFKLLPLETKKECLIGKINQIEIFSDTIYVLDSNIAKGLFLFNKNGTFIKKIGNIGKGPGEYLSPSSFSIDRKTKNVIILDTKQRKVIIFSSHGSLIREINNLKGSIPLQVETDDNFLYIDHLIPPTNVDDCLLYAYDKSGNVSTKWLPNNIYQKGFLQLINISNNFFRTGNDIKYVKPIFDTIYSIQGNSIKPYIAILTENKISKKEIFEMNSCNGISKFHSKYRFCKKFMWISDYQENSKLTMFKVKNNIETHSLFYYHDNSEVRYTNYFIDDLTKRPEGSLFYFAYNNYFISCIQNTHTEGIGSFIKSLKDFNISLSKEERLMMEKITPNSNPIIVLYECREKFNSGN